MARYRLFSVADRKIESIYEYSLLRCGEAQADSYFLGLHDLFELVAGNPLMGRQEPDLGDGIRRFVQQAHIVFYRPASDGIFILDLKGARQHPPRFSGWNDQ